MTWFIAYDCNNLIHMLHVALFEPEIPPNTGNIARLCAATGSPLHIVGVPGFRMDDRTLKRAGLDYWQHVELHRHIDLESLQKSLRSSRFLFLTTKSDRLYTDVRYEENDCIVFGPETRGLPGSVLLANHDRCLKIPMQNPNVRSLNLATSVGIVLYEAIRQHSTTNSTQQLPSARN
ncbi:MAG TPA: tRNA (cytidine(34)-2'-O)-methyltransferase [Pyrinomonadaceae bacterium]|nr:tRNA (cytidine(34)-2'-O)-methyltransferase [Pyrinomonadaceae bacterium]HRK50625.1 tRNA (cytidine(34)-2'-O)-methyltransferase [Pyrinomonadaceae bacterium]